MLPLVDPELKKIAQAYMRKERPGHILQTTALVNEALLKLISEKNIDYENRKHFYAFVARRMRQVLVDYVRNQWASRGRRVDLAEAERQTAENSEELILLGQALSKLASIDDDRRESESCSEQDLT